MPVSTQLLLVLLLNLRVQCARIGIRKTGIGPIQLWADKGPQGPFNETFNLDIQRSPSVYHYDHPEISSRPLMDSMDLYQSQSPEDPRASGLLEADDLDLDYPSPGPEEIVIVSLVETSAQDFVLPSVESAALSNFDPQASEAPNLEFMLPSSDLSLQPFETPDCGVLPSRSPASFTGIGISASTTGSSETLSGRTAPSRVAGITAALLVVFATLTTIVMIVLYGRNVNPYRPFITGASLSEESFDFARETVPEVSNDVYNSGESNSHSRRYEATSLNRDIEPAKRLEAAKLLEDIPDRHCR